MTSPPAEGGELARAFPAPGARLGTAYRDLFLAAEGTDNQKAVIGDPSRLPRPWDPPTLRTPALRAELWAWLEDVVDWLNHEYMWDPQPMIPPCWPLHPHLVHGIAVLADQRRRAGIDTSSNTLEEWHRYTVPAFLDRLRQRIKSHCSEHHQPSPARTRHARHSSNSAGAERMQWFSTDVRANPLGPRRKPIMRLVDESGSAIDVETGEVV